MDNEAAFMLASAIRELAAELRAGNRDRSGHQAASSIGRAMGAQTALSACGFPVDSPEQAQEIPSRRIEPTCTEGQLPRSSGASVGRQEDLSERPL